MIIILCMMGESSTEKYCITIPGLHNPTLERYYPHFGFVLRDGEPRVFDSIDDAIAKAQWCREHMPRKFHFEIRKYFGKRNPPLDTWWNPYEISEHPVKIL